MFKFTDARLAKKSTMFRYVFFLISGFRLTSYQAWSKDGEPNPFAAKTYRAAKTERVEFTDIFEDVLR